MPAELNLLFTWLTPFPSIKSWLFNRSSSSAAHPLFAKNGRSLIAIAAINGIFSALRWPDRWSLSFLIFDYHYGFGKRGAIGSVISIVEPGGMTYLSLALLSYAAVATWMVMLVLMAARWIHQIDVAAALLLFFLSTGFASLVCDAGYLENWTVLITLVCLATSANCVGLVIRAALSSLTIIIHEASLILFVPVIVFDSWLEARQSTRSRSALRGGIVLIPTIALTYYVARAKTACNSAYALSYFQAHALDFKFSNGALQTLCRDSNDNLFAMEKVWSWGPQWWILLSAIIVISPAAVFAILCAACRLKRDGISPFLVALPALSPILILLVASDIVRFLSIIDLTSFLCLLTTARRLSRRTTTVTVGGLLLPAAMSIAAFELCTSVALNDGKYPLKFPYQGLVLRALMSLNGDAPFVRVPDG